MSACLTKEGKPTDDVQEAGEFDHDAHMQKVNDYIEKMNDDEIETVIHDGKSINVLVSCFKAYQNKNKKHKDIDFENWQKVLMLRIDAEIIAYAERNI